MCFYRKNDENDKTCINSFNGFYQFCSKLIMKAYFYQKDFFQHSLSLFYI